MVRTRFAPSPTGFMHVGNLRTALYEYLVAKSQNGTFVLRIEDTDQERYVEGATDVIYNTLQQVGLQHDEGPDIGGEYGRMYRANARIFINPTQSSLCARARHTIASAPKSASSPFIRTASSAATTVIAATCPQRKFGRTSTPVCRMSFVSVCRSRAPRPLKTPFTAPSRSKTKRSKIRCF